MYEDFSDSNKDHFRSRLIRLLYLSERHREALAHLMYGLQTDGGFVLITGEVGTGKTTLIRSLIDAVPEDLDVAFILNPRLTVSELLETLCEELGFTGRDAEVRTNKHQIDRINKHLLRTHALGRSTVVIIDEARTCRLPYSNRFAC
jgi:general secretion pathway protein A